MIVRRPPLAGAAALALLALCPLSAPAQSSSWSQATAGTYNWSTAANWTGGVVANGANNTATFATPNLTGQVNVTLDTARTIGALVFDNPTNTFGWSVGGGNTLTLSNTAGPSVAVNNAAISATLAVQLAGTQNVAKTGPGTLVLTGNNTGLTGGFTVADGVLTVAGNGTSTPLGTGTVMLAGGTLRLGAGIGFTQKMVVPAPPGGTTNGGALFTASVANGSITATMDGGTSLAGDTWYQLGANSAAPGTGLPMGTTITSVSNPSLQYTLQPVTANNALLLDAAHTTGTFNLTTPTALPSVSFLTSTGSGAGTLTATIHFTNGTPDETQTFTSPDWFNNTPIAIAANGRVSAGAFDNVTNPPTTTSYPALYDETINVTNSTSPIGSIDLSWTGPAGAHTAIMGVSTPVLNGDAAQNFTNAVAVTADSAIDVRSTAGAALGAVTVGSNTLTVTGNTLTLGAVTLTGNPTLNIGAGATVTPGAFSDGGTVRTLTKSGAGTLTLGTASPGLSAGTGAVVNAGTVNLNNATALGASPAVTLNGGTLNLGTGVSPTFTSLAGANGAVTLNGNTLTVNGPASTTFGGSLADGSAAGRLVKAGTGALTLTGGGTFSGGTTVSGGTLTATAPGTLGTGAVTLAGGTLVVRAAPPVAINGNPSPPTITGDNLMITPAANGAATSAWNNNKVTLGSFTSTFTYQVTAGTTPPADGFTFALQNQGLNALGAGGGGLGIQGVAPSVALGVNIYPNSGGGAQGIATFVNGNQVQNPYLSVAPVNLTIANGPTGNPIDFTFTYDATASTLTVMLAEETTTNTFTTTFTGVNLATLLGSSSAFIGFTGGTGGLNAEQHITNFVFNAPAQAAYANPVTVNAGTSTLAVAATAPAPTLTLGPLTMSAGSTLNVTPAAGTPANLPYGLSFPSTTLSGNATFDVANNGGGVGTLTLGTVSGAGGLTKTGLGRLNATGTVGGPLVLQAGTLAPGTATGPGLLNAAGGATFTGGTFAARLNGTTAGTQYSQLAVTGTAALGAGITQLATSLGYAPSAADQLAIITAGTVTGTFAGLPNNTTFLVGAFNNQFYSATIQYNPTSVVLTGFAPVPEPAHLLLLCGAAGAAGWWRRKRARAGGCPTA